MADENSKHLTDVLGADRLSDIAHHTGMSDPRIIAHLFWRMTDDDQVVFFRELSKISNSYERHMQGMAIRKKMRGSHEAEECVHDLFVWFFPLWARKDDLEVRRMLGESND